MRESYFLSVIMLICSCLSAVSALAAGPATSDVYPDTPGEVIKAMLTAANAQNFDKAKSYTDGFIEGEEMLRKNAGGIKEYWRVLLHDFTYVELEVLAEMDTNGEHVVRSLIHFADKKQTLVRWHLKRIDGKWKVINT